ncbi:hypothetical protein V1478_014160 [Vespula squamosa]|uniref:Uncharacterized protein n=1 Tax=Vespula squamosa TaxID=30214 RepID=A0ABD2A785_VESSQ
MKCRLPDPNLRFSYIIHYTLKDILKVYNGSLSMGVNDASDDSSRFGISSLQRLSTCNKCCVHLVTIEIRKTMFLYLLIHAGVSICHSIAAETSDVTLLRILCPVSG